MSWLLPLPVVVPLLAAALALATDHVVPRLVHSALVLAGVGTAFGFAVAVMLQSMRAEQLHWFGGWTPRSGVSLGVAFAADPLGGGAAVLACGITFAALVYSLTFISDEKRNYDVLMSVLCGALCGFVLSGDLFNLFVWLELMGVAGYALTGFDLRRLAPLQGAINFAVIETIGGYFVAIGIALLYARTGALNLAQIGRTLAGEHATSVVIVALTVVMCGFLVKAAIVPFHFWLADAYAVAPAPVCLIFAGVMTDIGLFGVARLWFVVFDASFGTQQRLVGDVLLWLGIVTALLGGVMALLQPHMKRMLAFSVISHVGAMLAGIALLSSKGLAGAASMLIAHGLLTGALFLVAGMRAVRPPGRLEGVLWFVGALALAGPPYVGVYLGHSLIDEAAVLLGRHWVQPLLWLGNALAAAALLRVGARVFLGIGEHDEPDIEEPRKAKLPLLAAVTAVLLALGLAVSVVPGLAQRAEYGADRFRDRAGYANSVLHGQPMKTTPRLPFAIAPTSGETLGYGIGSTLLAVLIAAVAVFRPRLARAVEPAFAGLHRVHTGLIGDYVMWFTVGTAVVGGVFALALH